jgi:putative phosphoribosyl transferase
MSFKIVLFAGSLANRKIWWDMFMNLLNDRKEAGLLLAEKLIKYKGKDAVVLAIPRGGVPIGHEIAKTLELPLDIVLSKKIGHPLNPEFAIGSVAADTVIVDPHEDVPFEYIENEIDRIREELSKKYHRYAGNREPFDIEDKIVLLVDDGIATGNTLLATVKMLRKKKPKEIVIVCFPGGSAQSCSSNTTIGRGICFSFCS